MKIREIPIYANTLAERDQLAINLIRKREDIYNKIIDLLNENIIETKFKFQSMSYLEVSFIVDADDHTSNIFYQFQLEILYKTKREAEFLLDYDLDTNKVNLTYSVVSDYNRKNYSINKKTNEFSQSISELFNLENQISEIIKNSIDTDYINQIKELTDKNVFLNDFYKKITAARKDHYENFLKNHVVSELENDKFRYMTDLKNDSIIYERKIKREWGGSFSFPSSLNGVKMKGFSTLSYLYLETLVSSFVRNNEFFIVKTENFY